MYGFHELVQRNKHVGSGHMSLFELHNQASSNLKDKNLACLLLLSSTNLC